MSGRSSVLALVVCCLLFVSCNSNEVEQKPGYTALGTNDEENICDPGDAVADASFKSGIYEEEINGEIKKWGIIQNGMSITPAGETYMLSRFPWGITVSPDGTRAYVSAFQYSPSIEVIDLTKTPPERVEIHQGVNNDHGMVLNSDGSRLYVAGGSDYKVHVYENNIGTTEGNELTALDSIPIGKWAGDVTISSDDSTLYVTVATQGKLVKINLSDNSLSEVHVGNTPYDVIVSEDGSTAYVSNWSGGDVTVVNTSDMTVIKRLEADKNPEGLAFVENGAYVVVTNSDADNLTVIQTSDNTVLKTIELDQVNPELKAWSPNAIVVHPAEDAHRAYIASADHNALEVLDTQNWQIIGAIPTAHYPVRVAMDDDGSHLAVVNLKGWGAIDGHSTHHPMMGVLQYIETPENSTRLAEYTTEVEKNTNRALGFFPDSTCSNQVPLPLNENQESVIEHVILVVKENKTYDELLGDLNVVLGRDADEWHDPNFCKDYCMQVKLKNENGDVADVTPNTHALATQFIDFVNYYADAEVSLQGHMWTTQADCNDFVEKTQDIRVPVTGADPTTIHYNRSIFDHLYNHGLNFRVYGEVVNFALRELNMWRDKIDMKYPLWSNGVTDIKKAQRIVKEWQLAVDTGEKSLFPDFIYIVLPNDHTQGGKAGAPTPQTHVADNDAAVGILADWLSHSPFWESSIMFVIEDDPQSSVGDHIDAHRSLCLAMSPWVKRGYMSTVHYSIPSLYRTIELILGLPPINKNTLQAPPMIDIFTSTPDTTAFDAIPMQFEPFYNPSEGKFAKDAEQWDWSTFDGHKGLGDHIWQLLHGNEPRPANAKRLDE